MGTRGRTRWFSPAHTRGRDQSTTQSAFWRLSLALRGACLIRVAPQIESVRTISLHRIRLSRKANGADLTSLCSQVGRNLLLHAGSRGGEKQEPFLAPAREVGTLRENLVDRFAA